MPRQYEPTPDRLRLLVLTSTYPRWHGDPEPGFVHELCKRLAGRFDVTVLAPHAPGALTRENLDGVLVNRYRYAPKILETLVNEGGIVANLRRSKWKLLLVPGFLLAQAWAAWRLMRREHFDVVHAHWLLPQGLVAALLRLGPGRRTPFVTTSHGADLYALRGGFLKRIKRFVLSSAAAATVVSEPMRESIQAIGAKPRKVLVLPMGVDLEGHFVPDPSSVRSRHEILFVGRLVEKKGLRHLLDAMPEVLRQVPDAHLTIAGFGPEREELETRSRALGLTSKVRFLGAICQSDLPSLYRRAALFVAPFVRARSGDQEGLGLVVVEAIGCCCPVVVSALPPVLDVLDAKIDADVLVAPGDPHALAQSIARQLADPAGARAAAEQRRQRIMDRYDWQQVANGYISLLSTEVQRPAESAQAT